jgi:hypothetical protein
MAVGLQAFLHAEIDSATPVPLLFSENAGFR